MTELDDVLAVFKVLYRYISTQTSAEEGADENTEADISYADFEVLYSLAIDEHAANAGAGALTSAQTSAAYCHLIADMFEQGSPDWQYKSQTTSPGVSLDRSVDKDGRVITGPRAAYEKLMASTDVPSEPYCGTAEDDAIFSEDLMSNG